MTGDLSPRVTIGIPTYNRAEQFLRQVVESALAQTCPGVEVLVSDNCSSDGTEELMRSWRDPRLRYFRQEENLGPNGNFNFLLSRASGDYFQLLQDDDLIDPDFVEACMNAVEGRTDVGVIHSGTRIIDRGGDVLKEVRNATRGLTLPELFFAWFRGDAALYLCSTLFNTRALREQGGFRSPRNLFQDAVAEFRLIHEHGRIAVEDIKASFRKHPDEMTFAARVSDWCDDSRYLLDLLCELAPEQRCELRRQGSRFLCALNYNRVARLPRIRERLRFYLYVYRRFGFCYSPLLYRFPRLREMQKKLRRGLGKALRWQARCAMQV